jgi:hypothetical protein
MSALPASRWKRFAGPAIILLTAAAATAPQLVLGNSCGHDFDFHLVSWLDAAQNWRQGIPYPHWAPSANFGAGEPRFIFYPPISWVLGAAFGLVLPWQLVPIALTFLCLAGTGLATRALARQALPDGPATLAGCTALFSAYTLFTAYVRSAFGELAGGFWIPLLLLFVFRDRNPSASTWRRAFDGSAAPLALIAAGAWLSDAPLGVMASYLLAAVALVTAWQWRSWAPVLRAATAATAGLALCAFYLYPVVIEQRWVAVREATDEPASMIENSWLFAHHAMQSLSFHDSVLKSVSRVCVYMVALALVGLFISWRRGTLPGARRWWIPLACIPPVVLLLQFPISLPIWNALPKLRFLQFPWRWLETLEAPMAIFLVSAVWPKGLSRHWRRLALAAGIAYFAIAGVQASHTFFSVCEADDAVAGMLETYGTGAGFAGADEYTPPGADDSLLAIGLPEACLTTSPFAVQGQLSQDSGLVEWSPAQGSCDATYTAAGDRKPPIEHLHINAVTPHAGYMILRLASYPAWQVRVNGRLVNYLPRRRDGLMTVPVPQGLVDLTVDWTTTRDQIAARWFTLLALALFAALCLIERKQARTRLS